MTLGRRAAEGSGQQAPSAWNPGDGEAVPLPPHRASRRGPTRSELHRLATRFELRLVPALAAAVLAGALLDDFGAAALIGLAVLLASAPVDRTRLPLALLPAARFGMAGASIAFGVAAPMLLLETSWLGGGSRPPIGTTEIFAVIGAAVAAMATAGAIRAWITSRLPIHVAAVGDDPDFGLALAAAGIRSHRLIGWIGPKPAQANLTASWLGEVSDLAQSMARFELDLLVLTPAAEEDGADVASTLTEACLELPVRMLTMRQAYEELLGHVPLGMADAAWYQHLVHPRFRTVAPWATRAFDLIVGSAIALVSLPILAVAAAAIKLEDRGSVIYRQRRLGESGEEFWMLKLRSMRADAEAFGPRWADEADERVTRVGTLLRRTHLDELPQLWNVLRGEMTLVGPRPERPEIVAELERSLAHYGRRYLVKPGITGWAQLRCGYSGSELGVAWKLCHELFYVKYRSVLLDVAIVLQTTLKVLHLADRSVPMPDEGFLLRDAVLAGGFATGAITPAAELATDVPFRFWSARPRDVVELDPEVPASAETAG
jgi:lipopolysaccharide/colanic/teichoic acid biosynthesis glycosyltransferase